MNTIKTIVNIEIPGAQQGTTASLQIKWTKLQYLYMTSLQGRPLSFYNKFIWTKLNKKERLIEHIKDLCNNYKGIKYSFEIIE